MVYKSMLGKLYYGNITTESNRLLKYCFFQAKD